MNDLCILSIRMGQESFSLFSHEPDSEVFGTIQIHSDSTCFMPPVWTQIHLLGKEQIGNTTKTTLDDTYLLSSRSSDWHQSSQNNKLYNLPFSVHVPSSISNSFQITSSNNEYNGKDVSLGGVYYTLEVKTASMLQAVIQPIHFHCSDFFQNNNKLMKPFIPRRVFWGIAKDSKHHQKWQYELEFLNTFNIVTTRSGYLSLKLRSMFLQVEKDRSDSCLVGCQIIQAVHMKGYEDRHHVLATTTRLLTSPSKTWSEPCQIYFDFSDNNAIIPTAESEGVCVEHFIKISFAFCNTFSGSAFDANLEFPIRFTGYTASSLSYKTPVLIRSDSARSSCSSIGEVASHDSAVCMSSFKSNNSIYFSS